MIIGSLTIYNSKPDKYGNCYFAFRYVGKASGKEVVGRSTGGDSNLRAVLRVMNGGKWDGVHDKWVTYEQEMKIREFDRMVKTWPDAGCDPEKIAAFIRETLGADTGTVNSPTRAALSGQALTKPRRRRIAMAKCAECHQTIRTDETLVETAGGDYHLDCEPIEETNEVVLNRAVMTHDETGTTRLELVLAAICIVLAGLLLSVLFVSETTPSDDDLNYPVQMIQLLAGPNGALFYSGCATDDECDQEWFAQTKKRGEVHDFKKHAGHYDATLTIDGHDYALSEFETAEAIEAWAYENNYVFTGGAK